MRIALLLIAVGLASVFAAARYLKPTDDAGRPVRLGTHEQLGLPPCTFYWLTGIPCPSCGMTTSFSHLAHGELANSLRANPAGTLLAVFCIVLFAWCVISAFLGRTLGIHDYEAFAARGVIVFAALLLLTWSVRLVFGW